MPNRLKAVRKALGKTQKEIAALVGITQNAYSYWERDTVKIDHKDMLELAKYFQVSVEFLSGEEYTLKIPPTLWSKKLRDEYESANEYKKLYMEYLYGKPSFRGDDAQKNLQLSLAETLSDNAVIYCRDGQNERRDFSNGEMDLFYNVFISLFGIDGKK